MAVLPQLYLMQQIDLKILNIKIHTTQYIVIILFKVSYLFY